MTANWNFEVGAGSPEQTSLLKYLILTAYTLKESQLSGLPGWADGEKYDIEAKGGKLENEDRLFDMLRGLLADRFKMQFRWVTKTQSVYALAVAKGGAKLKPSVKEAA